VCQLNGEILNTVLYQNVNLHLYVQRYMAGMGIWGILHKKLGEMTQKRPNERRTSNVQLPTPIMKLQSFLLD
jgi:hypothetical protein